MSRRTVTVALAAIDVGILCVRRPEWGAVVDHLAAPRSVLAADGSDAYVATLASAALWLCAAWLAVGLLASVVATRDDLIGVIAHHVARRTLPGRFRAVLVSAAGAGLVLAPTPSAPHHHQPARPATAVLTNASSPGSSDAWPVDAGVPVVTWPLSTTGTTPATVQAAPTTPAPTPTPAPAPAPSPTAPTTSTAATPAGHPAGTSAPPRQPAQPMPTVPSPSGESRTVRVRPGDSLWRIAADRLGPRPTTARIAAAWPGWYAANRGVIGADPGLIRPGQTLTAPTPTAATPTTSAATTSAATADNTIDTDRTAR